MSIYKEVLGKDFEKLHPKLQQRYELMGKKAYQGSGVMHEINGGPKWLYLFFRLGTRWKLLFPEHGKDIPFTIKNTPSNGAKGELFIHWERMFHFNNQVRYFNALMSLDKEKNIIKDYLGEPARLYSDLVFKIDRGDELLITSRNQRLIMGKLEIPLSRIFQGIATVREGYSDSEQMYTIEVNVQNPIIGRLFSYKGVFTQNELS